MQEGLTNVRKHAGAATTAAVSLTGTAGGLAVVAAWAWEHGLMRER